MTRVLQPKRSVKPSRPSYVLEEQIGFILRQVWQRHAAIFAREIGINLTPTQWAALAKLTETGPCSQNQLGRLTAMDVATIKGVIDRLTARGLTETSADQPDPRRRADGREGRAQRARHHQGNAGAARRQRTGNAGGAVEQATVNGGRGKPRHFYPTLARSLRQASTTPERLKARPHRQSTTMTVVCSIGRDCNAGKSSVCSLPKSQR
jgi:hypothetical protein